jgi:hypothetical protein
MKRITQKTQKTRNKQRKQTRKSAVQKGGTKRKSINCHPAIEGKSIDSKSCLTPIVIEKIKKIYNKKHPQHPLLVEEPDTIYQELSKRFSESCKEEKCWIRKIIQEDAEEVEKHLYRPTSPADWKQNPVEWLSNFDIEGVMNQYEEAYPEFEFLGPVPIDFDSRAKEGDDSTCVSRDVCSFHLAEKIGKGKTKVGIVFNLSPSTSSGSHWVSLYVHLPDSLIPPGFKKGKKVKETKKGGGFLEIESEEGGKGQPWGKETAYCFFFDSAGESAPNEVAALVKRLQEEWLSDKTLNPRATKMYYDCNHRTDADHQQGNTECGVYSLFFLTTMLTGKCAGGAIENGELKESEICSAPLTIEQEKVDYFQGKAKNEKGGRLFIPDEFMVKLRKYYFNPHP